MPLLRTFMLTHLFIW